LFPIHFTDPLKYIPRFRTAGLYPITVVDTQIMLYVNEKFMSRGATWPRVCVPRDPVTQQPVWWVLLPDKTKGRKIVCAFMELLFLLFLFVSLLATFICSIFVGTWMNKAILNIRQVSRWQLCCNALSRNEPQAYQCQLNIAVNKGMALWRHVGCVWQGNLLPASESCRS